METEPPERRGRASHAVRVGTATFIVGAAMMFLPLLLARSSLDKYIVALGMIGALIGLGCLTNGAIDLFRARSR